MKITVITTQTVVKHHGLLRFLSPMKSGDVFSITTSEGNTFAYEYVDRGDNNEHLVREVEPITGDSHEDT